MLAKTPFGSLPRLPAETWKPMNRIYRFSDSIVAVSTDLVIVPIPSKTSTECSRCCTEKSKQDNRSTSLSAELSSYLSVLMLYHGQLRVSIERTACRHRLQGQRGAEWDRCKSNSRNCAHERLVTPETVNGVQKFLYQYVSY